MNRERSWASFPELSSPVRERVRLNYIQWKDTISGGCGYAHKAYFRTQCALCWRRVPGLLCVLEPLCPPTVGTRTSAWRGRVCHAHRHACHACLKGRESPTPTPTLHSAPLSDCISFPLCSVCRVASAGDIPGERLLRVFPARSRCWSGPVSGVSRTAIAGRKPGEIGLSHATTHSCLSRESTSPRWWKTSL